MNTNIKNVLTRLSVAVAALAMGICFAACNRADQKSGVTAEKVTIAYSATPDAVIAIVAQEKGFYREEGLETISLKYPYGKLALDDLLEGKADFATVAETPVMFAVMGGKKISIIATIKISNKDNAIIARTDRGIRTPGDLRGRKVAVTSGTTSDFFLDNILMMNGISRKDVKAKDMPAGDMPEALLRGDIDAVATFGPYILHAQKKLGSLGTTFYDEDLYTSTFNVVATQEFISKNPGKVKKMLAALIRAEDFVINNPAKSQKITADFSAIEIAIVRNIWADTTFRVKLDQSLIFALEDESRWAIERGLTSVTKFPNYLDFIYTDALLSVKPEAVNILR